MAKKTIIKHFEEFNGLNKSVSDLVRDPSFPSQMQNCYLRDDGALVQRPGGKVHTAKLPTAYNGGDGDIGVSLHNYSYLNSTTGGTESELLAVGGSELDGLFKLSTGTLTITKSGSDTIVYSFLPDGTDWVLDITVNGTSASGFPKTYGTGQELSPTTLSTVATDISGVTDLTAVASIGTPPAAVLPIDPGTTLASGANAITFSDFTAVPSGIDPSPQIEFEDDIGWTKPSALIANNVFYITLSDEPIFKYDGLRYYRAGIPNPTLAPPVTATAGSLSAGPYSYSYCYVNVDNRGQIVRSDLSDSSAEITYSSQNGLVTVLSPYYYQHIATLGGDTSTTTISLTTDLYQDDEMNIDDSENNVVQYDNGTAWANVEITEYDREAQTVTTLATITTIADSFFVQNRGDQFGPMHAKVNGTQTVAASSPITVDTGHTFIVGDPCYVYDRSTSNRRMVRGEVTATTATTITLDIGVSVTDEDPLNGSLYIEIYRTESGGSTPKLWLETPADFTIAATTFEDKIEDASLGPAYPFPVRTPGLPPKGRYLSQHQGLTIVAGGLQEPNTVFFSEPGQPENFPVATNAFDVPFQTRGAITGLVSDRGVLIVFKELERAIISGDIATGAFRVDVINDGVGCVAHDTIQDTQIGVMWLSTRGFERSLGGQLDPDFYKPLSPEFLNQEYEFVDGTAISSDEETKLKTSRATSVDDQRNKRYVCFVPALTGTPGESGSTEANTNSKWFVFDYKNNSWATWVLPIGLNAVGGWAIHKNEMYWLPVYDADTGDLRSNLIKEHNRRDVYDGADNVEAINMVFGSSWEHFGEPSVLKKFLRQKTWQMDQDLFTAFTMTLKTYKDFDETAVHSQATQSFSASTVREIDTKLKAGKKAKTMKVELSNNTLHEVPQLNGYAVEAAAPYRTEMKE